MLDRQPKYPGRVRVTLDAASSRLLGVPEGTVLGGVLTRDDEPFVEGHKLNKATLFRDATAKMLGLEPSSAVPDDALRMLAALVSSSGNGNGDIGNLEDTTLEVGSFQNTGAGWNSFKFREPFDAPPHVVLQAEDFSGIVQIKDITPEGFSYCLRAEGKEQTAVVYTGAGVGNNPSHQPITLVNHIDVFLTTALAVTVHYIAIEYGGER